VIDATGSTPFRQGDKGANGIPNIEKVASGFHISNVEY
jgi:hypothetical protein